MLARKYFSHSAILKEGTCVRAMLGLVQCCNRIAAMLNENKKLQDMKNAEILAAAKIQLKQAYESKSTGRVSKVALLFD